MGLSMRELMTLDIVARDEASPTIQKVASTTAASGLAYKQASIRALTYSKVLRSLSRGLTIYGALSVGAAVLAGKAAMDFEHQMALVHTQTDISKKSFDNVTQSLLDFATKTSRPLDELTSGLYDIFSGIDVNGKQAMNMLKSISKAAQAGDTDVRTATRATLSQLNAFGLGANKTNMILDQQFQLLKKSTGTYEELASAIGMVQPSAVAAGQSLLQVNAGLAFMTKAGFTFSEAATRVGRAMDYLTRPTVTAGLKKIGVDVFDASGKTRDLNKIVTDFGKKLQGLSDQKRKKIFADIFGAGEVRANSFFNLATKGFQAYNKGLREVSNSSGALDRANKKVGQTFAVQWGKFLNLIHVTAISIGNTLLPIFSQFVTQIGKLFSWFNKLDPSVKAVVGKFLLWGGVISLVAGRLTKMLAGAFSITSMRLWSGAASDAAKAATGLGSAASATAPKVATLGSAFFGTAGKFIFWAGLVAGAVFLIVKNWDTVKKWFSGFISWWQSHWKQIWNDVKPIIDAIVHGFLSILKIVGKALGSVVSWIGKFVAKMLSIKPVVQGIVVFLSVMIGVKLVQAIVSALATIVAAFVRFGAAMLAAARANWITLLIAAIVTAAYLIITNWAKVKDFFAKLWNGIERGAITAANWIIDNFINPVIVGFDQLIKLINDVNPFKDIPQVSPIQNIKMPAKYISHLDNAAGGADKAAKATGEFGNAAGTANANLKGLNSTVDAYGKALGGAHGKTKALTGSLAAIQKSVTSQMKAISAGTSGYFNLDQAASKLMAGPFGNGKVTDAARITAGAIRQEVAVEERHLNTILKTVPQGKGYAHMLANMGNVSSQTKDKTAGLISATANLGIHLSKAEQSSITLALSQNRLGDVNKILEGKLKAVSDTLKKQPKNVNTKVNIDSKNAKKDVNDVSKNLGKIDKKTVNAVINAHDQPLQSKLKSANANLGKIDKKTVWATINAKDEPAQKKVNGVDTKLKAIDKKTVWATIDSHDEPFTSKVKTATTALVTLGKTKAVPKVDVNKSAFDSGVASINGAIRQLMAVSVNIPVSVSATTDPYAYGYAMGLAVAAGARAALQSHSPSRVFIKIGKDILKGLSIGLADAALLKELDNKIKAIKGIIVSLPAILTSTFKLLSKGTAEALNQATTGFQKYMDKVSSLKDKIKDLRDTITQHISDIKSKLKDLDKAIADKGTKAAEKAKDILKKNKLEDLLKQWMDVSHLPNTLQGVASKLQSWGNDLQRRMTALNNKVQSFVGDFRSGFQQGTDIVGILGGEEKGKINVKKFFRDKIAEAKKWSSTLKQLSRKGLNPVLLQELAAAGPDALPLAQEILKTGVKFVNKQQGVLNTILGTTQKFLVKNVFGDQIDALAKEAEKFRNALKALTKAIYEATHPNAGKDHPGKPGGGHDGNGLTVHYHANANADAKALVRELAWFWRTHKMGA